ncbi:unnamed protein product [Rotaria sp. Silwood1]|nr:unnamed protein product [Rotaria sp. Silwood1]
MPPKYSKAVGTAHYKLVSGKSKSSGNHGTKVSKKVLKKTSEKGKVKKKILHTHQRRPGVLENFIIICLQGVLTVYRGQGMQNDDLKKLMKRQSDLLSFNNFLSTSTGRQKVNLKLTDDNDEQLQSLTDHIHHETRGLTGWHRLGSLMIAMGQFDKSEEFCTSVFEMTSDDNWTELAYLHHQFGRIHDEKGDLEKALDHYEEALDIQLDNLSSDDPSLSMTYTGIGSILLAQDDFDEALGHFQHALDVALRNQNSDLSEIATIHSYMGGVIHEQKQYIQVLKSYQEALTIRQKLLPPAHPLLATIYNNIGLLREAMNDHLKASSFTVIYIEDPQNEYLNVYIEYQTRAVDIVRVTNEPNHPLRTKEENDLKITSRKVII